MANVRQSTVGSADICAQRIVYDLDPNVPYGSGIARALGTAAHAGLETYYRARMNGETPTTLSQATEACVQSLDDEIDKTGEAFSWQFQHPTKTKAEVILDRAKSIEMLTKLMADYFLKEWFWPLDWEVVAVEAHFMLPIPGGPHTATGHYDLLLRDPNGWLCGQDHKTGKDKTPKAGKFAANSTPQAAVYTWAIQTLYETDQVKFVYDYMSWAGTFHRIEEPRSAAQIESTLARANLVGDLIDAGGPFLPNPTHFLCSPHFCDHWDRCPFGKPLVPIPNQGAK